MSKLYDALAKRAAAKKKSLVVYLTAGDPNLSLSEELVSTVIAAGADVVELGVPFSDPVGDGPVNQKAAERALKSGMTLEKVFEMAERIALRHPEVPLVLFSYFNPLYQYGLGKLAARARKAGIAGVLAVDLPPEEAGEYSRALASEDIGAVFLASPTTAAARLGAIDSASTGFVYYVSRTGVTGAQKNLSASLGEELLHARRHFTKPVVVGFGISTPEQAQAAAAMGDGVVVGSAVVSLVEKAEGDPKRLLTDVGGLVKKLAQAVHEA